MCPLWAVTQGPEGRAISFRCWQAASPKLARSLRWDGEADRAALSLDHEGQKQVEYAGFGQGGWQTAESRSSDCSFAVRLSRDQGGPAECKVAASGGFSREHCRLTAGGSGQLLESESAGTPPALRTPQNDACVCEGLCEALSGSFGWCDMPG